MKTASNVSSLLSNSNIPIAYWILVSGRATFFLVNAAPLFPDLESLTAMMYETSANTVSISDIANLKLV